MQLFRPDGCIVFGVQSGSGEGVAGFSDDEFEHAVQAAFDAWASVDCGGGRSPSLEAQSVGVVDMRQPHACARAPEHNIDAWLFSPELAGREVVSRDSGATAGVTQPSYFVETGEVYDADVTLNELWFGVVDEEEHAELLRVVATHEAGHALGLAHSQDPDSLMFRSYAVDAGRGLAQDDVDGVCALYPPGGLSCPPAQLHPAAVSPFECRVAEAEPPARQLTGGGCAPASVAGRGRPATSWPWWVLAMWWLLRVGRRGRTPTRATALLCACAFLGCEGKPRGEPEPPSAQPAHARLAPGEPALLAEIEALAGRCKLDEKTKTVHCASRRWERLREDFVRDRRSRVRALATLTGLLFDPDARHREVAISTLAAAFSVRIGEASAPELDPRTADALLEALGKLPLADARRIAPVAALAASSTGRLEPLYAVVDAREDRALTASVYSRLMTYGGLAAFPRLAQAAAGADDMLAAAALAGGRDAGGWNDAVEAQLCPWALAYWDHPSRIRVARASQLLRRCQGQWVQAVVAKGRSLRDQHALQVVHLTALQHRCEPGQTEPCAAGSELLRSILQDAEQPGRLRVAALSTLAYLHGQDGESPHSLRSVASQYAGDSDPLVKRKAEGILARLGLPNAASNH